MSSSSGSENGPPALRWEGPVVIFDDTFKLDDDLSMVPPEFALTLALHRKPEEYNVLSAGTKEPLKPAVRCWLAKVCTRSATNTVACLLLSERNANKSTAFNNKSTLYCEGGPSKRAQ